MEDIKAIVKEVIKEGFEFELYLSKSSKTKIDIEDRAIDRIEASKEQGIGIRVIKDGKMGFSYTTKLYKEDIKRCTLKAIEIAKSQESVDSFELLKERKPQAKLIELLDENGLSIDKSQKVKTLLNIEDKIKNASPLISLVRDLSYTESKYTYYMENSYDVSVEESMSGFFIMGCAIAKSESDSSSACSYVSSRFYEDLDTEFLIKDIVDNTLAILDPRPFDTRSLPVVLSNSSVVSLLRTFSSIFLGDALIKNRTLLKDRAGQTIAHPDINIIDDGTLDRVPGSSSYDADGLPTQKNIVIENGVFKGFLHNIYTASKTNSLSTANSIRSGYKSIPQTGIHNLYLVPKENSFEKLLGYFDECVYITELMGLHMADPISGNFSLGASGVYYKSSKPLHAIRGVTIASNFLELLKKVELIGNDFRFFGHVGAPSILIKDITIGGV